MVAGELRRRRPGIRLPGASTQARASPRGARNSRHRPHLYPRRPRFVRRGVASRKAIDVPWPRPDGVEVLRARSKSCGDPVRLSPSPARPERRLSDSGLERKSSSRSPSRAGLPQPHTKAGSTATGSTSTGPNSAWWSRPIAGALTATRSSRRETSARSRPYRRGIDNPALHPIAGRREPERVKAIPR